MLQALLADRFKLILNKDTRPRPGFALTVEKGKLKLKEAAGSVKSGCQYQQQPDPVSYATVSCRNMTMDAFAQYLRGVARDYLTNPVVNSTRLKGSWNFDFKWNYRYQVAPAGADGISAFDTIEKQLGADAGITKDPGARYRGGPRDRTANHNPPGVAQILPPPPPAEFEVAVIKPSTPEENF
jgi:uncharacterized protein (TIGR03435 family)